jgi:F-type H+-transporting ATPase subunit b
MDQLLNDFSPGLFFMQAIILLILILLMRKFAWKPILDSLQDREDGIKDALDSADKAKKDMLALNADNERILKEARAERDSLLKDAREIKDRMITEAKDEAKEEAKAIMASATATIEVEKKAAIAELKKQVAHLSIEIAEKVIKKELASKDDQLALVDKILADVTLK